MTAVFQAGPVSAGPHDPAIMAVINRSTNSFYTSTASNAEAVDAAGRALAEGAAIVDIGGVRAGRGPEVSVAEEIDLVCPVIAEIAAGLPGLAISVDTWRHEVAEAAVDAGAHVLNDTWAGSDPEVARVAGRRGVGLVCSHTGGVSPRTDAHRNSYGARSADVVVDVHRGLADLVAQARAAGVADSAILVDPTPDFGKNTRQSLAVIRDLPALSAGEHAVLLAVSRKDFIGETIGVDDPAQRLAGTIATTAFAIDAGVGVIRAHDVAETRHAIDMVLAIRGDREPLHTVRGLR